MSNLHGIGMQGMWFIDTDIRRRPSRRASEDNTAYNVEQRGCAENTHTAERFGRGMDASHHPQPLFQVRWWRSAAGPSYPYAHAQAAFIPCTQHCMIVPSSVNAYSHAFGCGPRPN